MKHGEPTEYRPRSRIISVAGNTGILALILAAFALWHSSQVEMLHSSYTNRIASLESEIRALETSNRLAPKSALLLKKIFGEIRIGQSGDQNVELWGIVLLGIGAFFLLTTIIAYEVVIRNRKAVESAFKDGYRKGKTAKLEEEDVEENAKEFIKNYVQKGGE
jgi:hypothetical protein